MTEALKNAIIELLNQQRICNVATCADGIPHNAAMEYVNEGTTLYFLSFPGTRKLQNIGNEARVAITVNAAGLLPREVRGVQYHGTARLVEDADAIEHVRTLFLDRNLLDPATHWSLKRMVCIQVTPQQIVHLDYSKGVGHTETWSTAD